LNNVFDITGEAEHFINQKDLMESRNIPLYRKSKDRKINNHGYRLINLCKNNNILIVNGRNRNDIPGEYTFRDTSVIDYYLSSLSAFKMITHFQIQSLDSLYSDGHTIISCAIKLHNFKNIVDLENLEDRVQMFSYFLDPLLVSY